MVGLRNIRKKPKLDMNPMVDMAFLLVTFFMMTTTFRPELPEDVRLPYSSAEMKLPEKQLATVTITETGKIFFGIDNKFDRRKLLSLMGGEYAVDFDSRQRDTYSLTAVTGAPVEELPSYLDAKRRNAAFDQSGIPLEELRSWIKNARVTNPQLRFAINADKKTKYPIVHGVIETFRDLNITRFNFVTETDAAES